MLKEAILAAKQSAWSTALPQLKNLLKSAEQQVLVYSRNLITQPDMNVHQHQELIAARRAELVAEAIISFHQSLFDDEASAEAAAVVTYLQQHNICKIIHGSMSNSGGPVLAPGQAIGTITYSP